MKGLMILCFSLFMAMPAIAATSSAPVDHGVQISVAPKSPIVIDGDFKRPNGPTVSGPWFKFSVNVDNPTAEPITVVAVNVTVAAQASQDTSVIYKRTLVPSDSNYTMACTAGLAWTAEYDSFGVIQPGESHNLYLVPSNAAPGVGVCTEMGATMDPAWLYVGGNPDPEKGEASSYSYNVQLELVGWYGTPEQPTSRFNKTLVFRTQ